MDRRLLPFAEFVALAVILAGGYTVFGSAKATAIATTIATAASEPRDGQPIAREVAREVAGQAAPPAAAARAAAAITAARPPVPLQLNRRTPYWVGEPRATTASPEAAVAQQTDQAVTDQTGKKVASDAAAKAMIEADGYKNVRSVVKAPDGRWRGRAMRGAVEVAVSVDDNGTVSTQ